MNETIMTISGIMSCIFGLFLIVRAVRKTNNEK